MALVCDNPTPVFVRLEEMPTASPPVQGGDGLQLIASLRRALGHWSRDQATPRRRIFPIVRFLQAGFGATTKLKPLAYMDDVDDH